MRPIGPAPMLPELSTAMRLSSGRFNARRAAVRSPSRKNSARTGMPVGTIFSRGMPYPANSGISFSCGINHASTSSWFTPGLQV